MAKNTTYFDKRLRKTRRVYADSLGRWRAFAEDAGAAVAGRQQLLQDLSAKGVDIRGDLPEETLSALLAVLSKPAGVPASAFSERQAGPMSPSRRRYLLGLTNTGKQILRAEDAARRKAGRS